MTFQAELFNQHEMGLRSHYPLGQMSLDRIKFHFIVFPLMLTITVNLSAQLRSNEKHQYIST